MRLKIFWKATDARFYDLSNRREVANNKIPANGYEEFFTPAAHIVEIWEALPYWKKFIAAAIQRLPATVIIQDAGGYSYNARFR